MSCSPGECLIEAKTTVATLAQAHERAARPACRIWIRRYPGLFSDVVVRCLEIDPQRRYQNAQEIWQDLEASRGKSKSARRKVPSLLERSAAVATDSWKWAAGALWLVLCGGWRVWYSRDKIFITVRQRSNQPQSNRFLSGHSPTT